MNSSIKIILVCLMVLMTPSLVLAAKTHLVKKNETVYSLAKKYHVTVAELKAANNRVNNSIKNGDVLVIPPHSTSAGAETHAKSGKAKAETYKVKKGDTLASISKKT